MSLGAVKDWRKADLGASQNMELEVKDNKLAVRRIAENHNIILEIQKKLKVLETADARLMAAKDQTVCLKTRQQLLDWLIQLERVEEANSTLRELKKALVEDIMKLQNYIDLSAFRRRNCATESEQTRHDFLTAILDSGDTVQQTSGQQEEDQAQVVETDHLGSKNSKQYTPIPTPELQTIKVGSQDVTVCFICKGLGYILANGNLKYMNSSIVPVSEEEEEPEIEIHEYRHSNGDSKTPTRAENKKKKYPAHMLSKAIKKLFVCGHGANKKILK